MADEWVPLDLSKALYDNLNPDAVGGGYLTALENGFVNEQGSHTRFPGMIERADLGDASAKVYLSDIQGDLIAVTDKGRIHRVDRNFTVADATGVPVSGGRRVIFAPTDKDELLMAAGGPIVRLRQAHSELLSSDAPDATHVGWIDGYTMACEVNSGQFFYDDGTNTWDPLNRFAADGNPDNINSMIVTPFREVILGGQNSIEQFERLSTGDVPFFRRWSVGEGVKFPNVIGFADNALWTINKLTELVRFSGQLSNAASAEIGRLLEGIDDWTDAWLGGYPDRPLHVIGQKFMVLQAPRATNPYGTKGVTIGYDYRAKKFFNLYGWDQKRGVPGCWPGDSHWTLWGKVFVGRAGKIFELSEDSYRNGSDLQRWLIRTSHIGGKSLVQINNFRLRVVRGLGGNATAPAIQVRCSRDGRPFGPWSKRSLGKAGDRAQIILFGSFGTADTFRFEISSADDCRIDLLGADILPEAVER